MTNKLVENDDVVCFAIPEGVTLDDPATIIRLNEIAKASVMAMWEPGQGPPKINFDRFDWLITSDINKINEFQPAHDCEQCRSGNERARAYLAENPGRFLAMANIHYTEVWPAWSKL